MTDKKYCIQLAECDGNSKDVYSFDEVEIGTWVDGKPIYRKVISGKLATEIGNGLVFVNVSDLTIDKVINLYGNMTDKNNVAQSTLQTSYNVTTRLDVAVNMYYYKDDETIRYHYIDNGFYSGSPVNVIIEYTKK